MLVAEACPHSRQDIPLGALLPVEQKRGGSVNQQTTVAVYRA